MVGLSGYQGWLQRGTLVGTHVTVVVWRASCGVVLETVVGGACLFIGRVEKLQQGFAVEITLLVSTSLCNLPLDDVPIDCTSNLLVLSKKVSGERRLRQER